jgi:Rieske Fe-S protein
MKTDAHKAPYPTRSRAGSALEPTNSPASDSNARSVAFPIPWEEEHAVTRRNFMSLLLLASTTFFASTGLVGLVSWLRRSSARQFTPAPIASIQEVPLGGVKLFSYPTSHDPCLLVHPAQGQFVAYSQKCTHLSCPVIYQAKQQEFFCPCHAGRFAVEDGRPLGGPPQRPLPSIQLKIIGTEIWAVGVEI